MPQDGPLTTSEQTQGGPCPQTPPLGGALDAGRCQATPADEPGPALILRADRGRRLVQRRRARATALLPRANPGRKPGSPAGILIASPRLGHGRRHPATLHPYAGRTCGSPPRAFQMRSLGTLRRTTSRAKTGLGAPSGSPTRVRRPSSTSFHATARAVSISGGTARSHTARAHLSTYGARRVHTLFSRSTGASWPSSLISSRACYGRDGTAPLPTLADSARPSSVRPLPSRARRQTLAPLPRIESCAIDNIAAAATRSPGAPR